MSFPKYFAYNDSGIEWLGALPEHWAVLTAKRLFGNVRDSAKPDAEQLAATQAYGVIPQKYFMEKNDVKVVLALSGTENFRDVRASDFVISLRSFQGGIEHSAYDGCVSPAYTVLRRRDEKSLNPGYFRYLLKDCSYISALQSITTGIREGRTITYEQFGSLSLPVAPVAEQTQIARFLDHETARIDTLIEEQQRLIELLNEKRQTVISHAVTKGLDPTVPMKDSGVEWLGEVPAHWKVAEMGFFADVTKLTGFEYTGFWEPDEAGEIIALRGFNVREGYLDISNTERISEKLSRQLKRSKLYEGDIVFPCTGTLGNAAEITENDKYHINQNIAKISFDHKVDSSFAVFWLTSTCIRTALEINNTSAMQPVVLIGDLRKLRFVIPSIDEQKSISEYLKNQNAMYLEMLMRASEMIELLTERRSALISAAVTGKIDVRGWQPPASASSPELEQEAV